MSLQVFIGYDEREHAAARVARKTLIATSGITPTFLERTALLSRGLLNRPVDRRGGTNYDLISGAPAATDFSISRFLTPILCLSGYALYTDCDVVFMTDVKKLLDLADPHYAVQVVRHDYTPSTAMKMDGKPQAIYKRKGWSSVMLFNCDHPANQRLSVDDVNSRGGLALHQFYWLNDHEIGDLPARWNWLIGEQDKPQSPAICHYTLGGPFTPGWEPREHDDIWLAASTT